MDASMTTLGSAPMSATPAMVRAGDVVCTPQRLVNSSRRSGTLVVWSLTLVADWVVRGRRYRGSVRWISCEREGARSYRVSAVSCSECPPLARTANRPAERPPWPSSLQHREPRPGLTRVDATGSTHGSHGHGVPDHFRHVWALQQSILPITLRITTGFAGPK